MSLIKTCIMDVLERANGNKALAAKILGIHRTGLYQSLKDMDYTSINKAAEGVGSSFKGNSSDPKVLTPIERKSPLLKNSAFGCLREVPSINITRGCLHSCVYCYATGFSSAPPKGEVYVYNNLVERLEREFKFKKKFPNFISFSTASDPFQPSSIILNKTYEVMDFILSRGIGISFLTKGFIPEDFYNIWQKKPRSVVARIGIVSTSSKYKKIFEPFSANINQRLYNIIRLQEIGIKVEVRVDPIIPFITDTEEQISSLLSKLKESNIPKISISCLIIRPSLYKQMEILPKDISRFILRQYDHEPFKQIITSAKTKLLPRPHREAIYKRFKLIAKDYGIDVKICGCKNPDLPFEFCMPWGRTPLKRWDSTS